MKKGILTSLICFTSMVLFSCGSKTVKVTLIGGEHLTWEKQEETISIKKDYTVKPICEHGYWLYDDIGYLTITINGNRVEKPTYTLDEETDVITIPSSSLYGNVAIEGKGNLKTSYITITIPSSYTTTGDITKEHELVDITALKISGTITNTSTMPSKDKIKVTSKNDVNFTYELISDNTYRFEIDPYEFYQDIKIEFPEL